MQRTERDYEAGPSSSGSGTNRYCLWIVPRDGYSSLSINGETRLRGKKMRAQRMSHWRAPFTSFSLSFLSCSFVISNHALLSLIEKPAPDSLVSLYSSFPGAVPPLIRKRGAELLQVMQDTASKFVTQFASDALEEDQPLSIAVDTSRHVVFSAQPTPVPDLWDIVSMPARVVSAKIASSKSSLLGTVMASSITSQKQSTVTSTPAKLSTRHSAFLGSGSFTTTAKTARPGVPAGGQLQQKIAKIHEGILKGNKKVIYLRHLPTYQGVLRSVVLRAASKLTLLLTGDNHTKPSSQG